MVGKDADETKVKAENFPEKRCSRKSRTVTDVNSMKGGTATRVGKDQRFDVQRKHRPRVGKPQPGRSEREMCTTCVRKFTARSAETRSKWERRSAKMPGPEAHVWSYARLVSLFSFRLFRGALLRVLCGLLDPRAATAAGSRARSNRPSSLRVVSIHRQRPCIGPGLQA